MKMRIFLLGLMGSVKTTVGKTLAKKLALPFYDLDELIEMWIGMSVSEYFAKFGEEKFRILEQEVLYGSFSLNGAVIATGGGTPCFFDNLEQINKHGISIYLQANEKLLCSRLKEGKEKRPLISNLSDDELANYMADLLEKREPFYAKANYTVSAIAPVDKIMEILNNRGTV